MFISDGKIGILGGGQLSRMLLEPAYRMGLKPLIYTASAEDPAAQLCPEAVFGAMDDLISLRRFLSQISICLFENEFIDCDLIDQAAEGLSVQFAPSLATLRRLQNKLRQKELLQSIGIPTAPHEAFDSTGESVEKWISGVLNQFSRQCVFKWAEQGYDGKGTLIVADQSDSEIRTFCQVAVKRGIPIFVEEKVSFVRELAVIGSYSTSGEFLAYPLVISEQRNGICRKVFGPATAYGVSPKLEQLAHDSAFKIAQATSLFGAFGIEFFETEDGRLLVNELAPRVHNTGHYSQDASVTSQFENHLRAVLGMRLGSTQSEACFGMLNLIGDSKARAGQIQLPLPDAASHLHWYGKAELRAGRKMGHFNLISENPKSLDKAFLKLESEVEHWNRQVTQRTPIAKMEKKQNGE